MMSLSVPPGGRPSESPADSALAAGAGALAGLCAAMLVALPLVFNGRAGDDAYFSPKWAWLASWTALGWAALAVRACLRRPVWLHARPVVLAAWAFLAVQVLGIAWARSRSLAAERTLQYAALTMAAMLALNVTPTRRILVLQGWGWMAVAAITALWTLYQDFVRAFFPEALRLQPNLPDWRGWLAAGLGNTNHIGDLLALALPLSLALLASARRRAALAAAWGASLVIPAGLTVCWSVGSTLGLLAGAAVMLVLVLRREGFRFFARRPRRWIALAAAWGLMLAFFMTDHPANPHRPGLWSAGFDSDRWREGGPTRLVIWAGALEMIRLHPVLGAGTGNFTYVFPEMNPVMLEARPDLLRYQGLWTNAAHNEILQVWSETGPLGLASLLAVVALAFASLLKGLSLAPRSEVLPRATLAGLLTVWCGCAMMNFSLVQPSGAVALYGLLAAIAAEAGLRPTREEAPPLGGWWGPFGFRLRRNHSRDPWRIGVWLELPGRRLRNAAAWLLLAAGAAVLVPLHRPLEAQAHYRRARAARGGEQGELLREAIRLDPRATGIRSRYSEWLVEQGRGKEALEELKRVRERLNSPELWSREARARMLLGERDKAERALAEYRRRVWAARQPPGEAK